MRIIVSAVRAARGRLAAWAAVGAMLAMLSWSAAAAAQDANANPCAVRPSFGRALEPGAARGPTTAMPRVLGQPKLVAMFDIFLNLKGFARTVSTPSVVSGQPAGEVVGQLPAAGAPLSPQTPITLCISQGPPPLLANVISFPQPANASLPAAAPALAASASSGLPVTYVAGSAGICAVRDGALALIAAGDCSITAFQAGDATHAAASPVTRIFRIAAAPVVVPPQPGGAGTASGAPANEVQSQPPQTKASPTNPPSTNPPSSNSPANVSVNPPPPSPVWPIVAAAAAALLVIGAAAAVMLWPRPVGPVAVKADWAGEPERTADALAGRAAPDVAIRARLERGEARFEDPAGDGHG